MAEIDIYLNRQLNGRLAKQSDKAVFSFALNAQEALSLTMPIRTESYSFTSLHPIFQMNLPEGHLRLAIERATAKHYGSDDLSMLAILGTNQIGRLGYAIAGSELKQSSKQYPNLDSILSSQDANLFNELLVQFATSSGVAGVQPKVLLTLQNEHDILPLVQGKATLPWHSYIVKSWGREYPQLACNEYVCLTLAKKSGLNLPDFYLSDNGKLFLTKRFDLTDNGRSFGFEDFCVLQGKGTKEKYDASLESCTNTIRQFVSPQFQSQALADFFKLTLINVLVRNGDAHLKNSGVIYADLVGYKVGEIPSVDRKLAPIFDIVSTVPYIKNDTMALSLTGSKRWPKLKVLKAFGKSHCNLKESKMNEIVNQVTNAAQETIPLIESLSEKYLDFKRIGDEISLLIMSGFSDN